MAIKTTTKTFCALAIFFILFGLAPAAFAAETVNFNVDENFEVSEKPQISTVLVKTYANLYFYVEKNWWDSQVPAKQQEILTTFDYLASEFQSNIYPILTSVFGSEWKPGVDGDNKITLVFHPMKEGVGGYFRSTDEYLKLQVPSSNEREMIFLATAYVDNLAKLKVFLAHEFTHLITFNQKERLRGVREEVWLDEARAEYALTALGYNSVYGGSNLQARARDFLERPSDSLVEWQGGKYDYGVLNLFTHYLVDHYGINMLSDSLTTKLSGIASINEVLLKNGYKEDFAQIFTNWTIASTVNDCTLDIAYCYLDKNLNNFRISPTLVFLPITGNSSLSLTNVTKNWSGNWQKIIGGNGSLTLKFSSSAGLDFKVPYIIVEKNGAYEIKYMALSEKQEGQITISDFGSKYSSLIIMPSLQTKTKGFNGLEFTYPYTLNVSIGQTPTEDPALIEQLLAQIESLKQQILALKANMPPGAVAGIVSCPQLSNNLYAGIANKADVTCLQQFLKNQGADIYPEGLVTGYFGSLTRAAVVRFQKKYGIIQTGFVGILTRAKINTILNEG